MSRRRLSVLLVAALLGGLAGWIALPLSNSPVTFVRPIKSLERFGFDALSNVAPVPPGEPSVIVSGFDTATEVTLGTKWPVSRKTLAQAIQNIVDDGATKVIVVVLLEGPSSDKAEDAKLNEVLRKNPGVVLSFRFETDAISTGVRTSLIPPYYDEAEEIDFEQQSELGFAEIPLDEDGAVRKLLPFRSVAGERYPAMAIAAAGNPEWSEANLILFSLPDSAEITGPDIAAAAANQFPRGTFRGKRAFLGLTGLQQTKEFNDLFTLSTTRLVPYKLGGAYRRQLPGVYVQALITDAVLANRYILQAGPFSRSLFGGVFCLVAAYLVTNRKVEARAWLRLASLILAGLVWIGLFLGPKLYFPLPSIFVTTVFLVVALELSERQRLKAQWGRYLSPGMLKLLHDSDREFRPSKRTLTILFADIRGFTAEAASMDPLSAMEALNDVFHRAVPIIHGHGGIIDKYLGDGFMAVFGFPETLSGTPEQAVAAAIEICNCSPKFRLGCGLATGEVAVGHLSGGSRTEFTFIGTAVNLAARLQSLLPDGGVLIDEATHSAASPAQAFSTRRELIRGFPEPIIVHQYVASSDPGPIALSCLEHGKQTGHPV